jgi:hypothetical protein
MMNQSTPIQEDYSTIPTTITSQQPPPQHKQFIYLSDEILQKSKNFCDSTHEILNEMQNYYLRHFTSNPMYRNLTKEHFIAFFNILYSDLYDKNMENEKIPTIDDHDTKQKKTNAVKIQIKRKCVQTIQTVRSSIISTFLEAFCLHKNDGNIAEILDWSTTKFSDTKQFYLVKFNDELGYCEFRSTKKRGREKKMITPQKSSSFEKSSNIIIDDDDKLIITSNDLFEEDFSPPSADNNTSSNVPIVSQDDNFDTIINSNDHHYSSAKLSSSSTTTTASSTQLQIEYSPAAVAAESFVFSLSYTDIVPMQQFDISSPTTTSPFSKSAPASASAILYLKQQLENQLKSDETIKKLSFDDEIVDVNEEKEESEVGGCVENEEKKEGSEVGGGGGE